MDGKLSKCVVAKDSVMGCSSKTRGGLSKNVYGKVMVRSNCVGPGQN